MGVGPGIVAQGEKQSWEFYGISLLGIELLTKMELSRLLQTKDTSSIIGGERILEDCPQHVLIELLPFP
jgi:hypothetical protein